MKHIPPSMAVRNLNRNNRRIVVMTWPTDIFLEVITGLLQNLSDYASFIVMEMLQKGNIKAHITLLHNTIIVILSTLCLRHSSAALGGC